MKFDFDSFVCRSGIGNLIEELTPKAIREAGLPSYWGAEFDFKTAPVIIEAVKKTADNGLFGFTMLTKAYLDKVCWWLRTQRSAEIPTEWVMPTHGVIFSLATALRAFTEPGDGMIMLTPGYRRYRQAASRLGRITIESPLVLREGRYWMDFIDLESKMKEKNNRILVLCNPNNPTGTVWQNQELSGLAGLAEEHNVIVFSDEIFSEIVFNGADAPVYSLFAGEKGNSISCFSLGKSFGLTGINHANTVIPNRALREVFFEQRNKDHYGSIDPFLHAALMAAYSPEGAEWLYALREYIWQNFLLTDSFFKKHIPRVSVMKPEGTYVLWIDFNGLGLDSRELGKFLTEEALLFLDEGETYGGTPGYMRMNISVPRKGIEKSLRHFLAAAKARGLC